jgi:hypothetical protein
VNQDKTTSSTKSDLKAEMQIAHMEANVDNLCSEILARLARAA